MVAYGLTDDGLRPKPQSVIADGIKERIRARFGASIPFTTDTLEGHYVEVISEALALLWQLGQDIYSSQDVDKATGQALRALSLITGTFPTPASFSAVTQTFTGLDGSSVTAGTIVRTESTQKQFVTTQDGTLVDLDPWTNGTPYLKDARVSNGGNSYQCTVAGVSAGSGGPTSEDDAIVDAGVTWRFLGNGTAAVDVLARATVTGPIVGASGDIVEIVTPVGGVASTLNVLDASIGDDEMSDEQLRALRNKEVEAPGTSTLGAVTAALLAVDGVVAATVFENKFSYVNADGMPPHSLEAMVQGGADQKILQALFDNVAAGILTTTTATGPAAVTGTVVDSQGEAHDFAFSRPVEVPIYVTVDLVKSGDYPVDGDVQVKQAIVDFGDAQPTGKDAVAWSIGASIMKVAGVLDVLSVKISTSPAPTLSTTILVTRRELATFDTSRIVVTTSDGTP